MADVDGYKSNLDKPQIVCYKCLGPLGEENDGHRGGVICTKCKVLENEADKSE